MASNGESLLPKHGGYRKLKSFQVAQLAYDVTVRFCEMYIDYRSRTRDQMVQAARSGVQNIAEGSQASGTSKKMELKLTNVARASLEELRLDYEDFLRHRDLPQLPPSHPALLRFKSRRCKTMQDVREWLEGERHLSGRNNVKGTNTDGTRTGTDRRSHNRTESYDDAQSLSVGDRLCSSNTIPTSALIANAALSLLNLSCYLLDRQLAAQSAAFEKEGGFTERLYRVRQQRRRER